MNDGENESRVSALTHQILELRVSIAHCERDIALKELEIFKLASRPQPVPVIQRGTFPRLVRDFLDTINGDTFSVKDIFSFVQQRGIPLKLNDKVHIRSIVSQEHRNGRLCKTLLGYQRPT